MKLRIISGSSNQKLAEEIALHAGIGLTNRVLKRFKDGEIYAQITDNVRGDDVFVVQSICHPVNDSLMEFLILIDALKRASAGRITAVVPYYGYGRQDRKAEAREPITAKLLADLITIAGADRMLAMDLHVPQIQGFFGIPVDEVSAVPLFSRYFLSKGIKNPVVVAPDAGSAKRARSLAKRLDCPIAIIDKRRGAHNEADVMNIVGDVVGKNAILIDDIIDTGNSVVKAVESLSRLASEVYICATHGVFSDNCIDKLQSCQAKEIVISNTIPVETGQHDKIKVLTIGRFLSRVIQNINQDRSVSELFN